MQGRLERIDSELAEAIAADHDLELEAITHCQEGVREWYVREIARFQDARAALRRLTP